MNDPLALSLSILLLVAAIVAAILGWPAWSAARRGFGQETFRERRGVLTSHRTQLSRAAGRFYGVWPCWRVTRNWMDPPLTPSRETAAPE